MEFTVIDIETTGSTGTGGRITEIAIVVTDGINVIDTYETLIDPEQKIPYFITKLTGITDEMVKGKPKFHEVAKKLIEITKDRIFVAHNSNFDYGFFKKEFKDLGYEYERKTICTVKSARKVFPGFPSYSLGKLAPQFGIQIKGRHRAMGDAEATAIIFHKMIAKDPNFINDFKLDNYMSDHLEVSKLPNDPGIYYFKNKAGEIIYVGKSIRLKTRIKSHLSNFKTKKGMSIIEEIHKIDHLKTANEIMASLYENMEIKKIKPIYNHAQKNTTFPVGLYLNKKDAYHSLTIQKVKEDKPSPIIGYKNIEQAKKSLVRLTEEYKLCEKINKLENSLPDKACFGYGIKKCNGSCIEKETPDKYNKRVEQLQETIGITKKTIVFTCEAVKKSQTGYVLLLNGYIKGFGFVKNDTNFNSVEQLLLLSEPFENDKDYQLVIKHLLKDNRFKKRYLN